VPNLKDIKRRIVSIEKTQQITRAMRMVSAAKLRRAQEAILAARPYAERMRRTLGEVAAAQVDVVHPLLEGREDPRHLELVLITSDRGLAGAFNANAIKCADAFLEKNRRFERFSLTLVGRKAAEYYRRRRPKDVAFATNIGGWVSYARAAEIARRLAHRYEQGEVDQVVLVHNEFISTMTQTPREVPLLPFAPAERAEKEGEERLAYSIEPSAEVLLGSLVPKAVEVEVFRALLESQAGEHAARMTAMESATRNTEELIDKLKLDYNRARQAAITKELVEIVTGAQALEG
jgi:F-type H+-transporting ATPase subunit gamma